MIISAAQTIEPSSVSPHSSLSPSPLHSSPSATATRLAEQIQAAKTNNPLWRWPFFFLTRSTVNCVLCPAMQMHVDQSRHDRTTPIWGLFPKPTAAPIMRQGFHGLPPFVEEKKIMTKSFSTSLPPTLQICRTAKTITV